MIKKLFQLLMLCTAGYVQKVLGAQAEFGAQDMIPGFKSNSDYSTLGAVRYVFVEATAARQAQRLATTPQSTNILGVMQNAPGVGEAMSIAYAGLSKVVAGAAISANAIISTASGGRAVAAANSGDIQCGRALEAAGAAGDVISALLFHPVRWVG